MGANPRTKGARFEREIAAALFAETGVTFKRNLEQSREAMHGDLVPDNPAWPFVIECKRYASGRRCLAAWREQAKSAAAKAGKIPVVVYRFDNDEVRAALPLSAFARVTGDEWCDIPFTGLTYLAREILAEAI